MNNLFKAFVDGYTLGERAARQIYGGKTIKVKQCNTTDGVIEMVRLDNGTIHNIGGRSIPF